MDNLNFPQPERDDINDPLPSELTTHIPGGLNTSSKNPFRRWSRGNRIFVALAALVLLAGAGFFTAHVKAVNAIAHAQLQAETYEEYDNALSTLDGGLSWWTPPYLHDEFEDDRDDYERWRNDADLEQQAQDAFDAGNYNFAIETIERLSDDYPGTGRIVALSQEINKQVAKAEAEARSSTIPKQANAQQPAAPQQSQQQTTQTETITQVANRIEQSLAKFNVDVTLNPTEASCAYAGWSKLTQSDLASLKAFESDLVQEFNAMPKDLVTNTGLKTIGLVKGLTNQSLNVASVPANCTETMLYDVVLMTGAGDQYSRLVVTHEFWHYADFAIEGWYRYPDAEWSACNPSGFTYGPGGESAYDEDDFTNTFHPQTSFITNYARYGIEEDRAELFSWLIYNPMAVKNLYSSDSKIKCKVERLEEIAQNLSPSIDF